MCKRPVGRMPDKMRLVFTALTDNSYDFLFFSNYCYLEALFSFFLCSRSFMSTVFFSAYFGEFAFSLYPGIVLLRQCMTPYIDAV